MGFLDLYFIKAKKTPIRFMCRDEKIEKDRRRDGS